MFDRAIEVFAIHGSIMLALVLAAHLSPAARHLKDDIKPMLIGWTLIAWVPGLIYITTGF